MTTKTITIMEDAYEVLVRNKGRDESFSDLIRRKFKKQDLSKYIGAWKHVSDKEAEKMKKDILEMRKRGGEDLLKLVKDL